MFGTETEKDIVSRFSYHIASGEARAKMRAIRIKVRELAFEIEKFCPSSREKSTALTQLSFVMMSANSAIAQECPIDPDDL